MFHKKGNRNNVSTLVDLCDAYSAFVSMGEKQRNDRTIVCIWCRIILSEGNDAQSMN